MKKAEFFLGSGFRNKEFYGKTLGENRLGISVSVKGEFFCTCRVSFVNGDEVLLDRYIDFGMARWLE